jgi:aldose 1-epimerase
MMMLANHEMPSGTSQAFDAITLRSSDGSTEADFVPTANMLCCSLERHGVEFLYLGAGVDAYAERGITMGIPLLHPWANRLAAFEYEAAGKHVRLQRGASPIPTDEAGLPIHGCFRR